MKILRNPAADGRINALSMQIERGGYLYADKAWHGRGVCSPYSRLFFITAGEGTVTVSGRDVLMRPGRVYLIPLGVTHDYACGESMEKLWFHVNMELYDGTDLFFGLEDCYELEMDLSAVEEARQGYLSDTASGAMMAEGLIYQAAARFAALTGADERAMREYSPLLRRLFPLVRASVSSKMTVRQLALLLNVSESTLTKRFRAETGQTLGRYLDGMLMQRARRLLLGDLSIAEISEQLEFCDQFYFSRYFHQHQGEAPSRYRSALKAQL